MNTQVSTFFSLPNLVSNPITSSNISIDINSKPQQSQPQSLSQPPSAELRSIPAPTMTNQTEEKGEQNDDIDNASGVTTHYYWRSGVWTTSNNTNCDYVKMTSSQESNWFLNSSMMPTMRVVQPNTMENINVLSYYNDFKNSKQSHNHNSNKHSRKIGVFKDYIFFSKKCTFALEKLIDQHSSLIDLPRLYQFESRYFQYSLLQGKITFVQCDHEINGFNRKYHKNSYNNNNYHNNRNGNNGHSHSRGQRKEYLIFRFGHSSKYSDKSALFGICHRNVTIDPSHPNYQPWQAKDIVTESNILNYFNLRDASEQAKLDFLSYLPQPIECFQTTFNSSLEFDVNSNKISKILNKGSSKYHKDKKIQQQQQLQWQLQMQQQAQAHAQLQLQMMHQTQYQSQTHSQTPQPQRQQPTQHTQAFSKLSPLFLATNVHNGNDLAKIEPLSNLILPPMMNPSLNRNDSDSSNVTSISNISNNSAYVISNMNYLPSVGQTLSMGSNASLDNISVCSDSSIGSYKSFGSVSSLNSNKSGKLKNEDKFRFLNDISVQMGVTFDDLVLKIVESIENAFKFAQQFPETVLTQAYIDEDRCKIYYEPVILAEISGNNVNGNKQNVFKFAVPVVESKHKKGNNGLPVYVAKNILTPQMAIENVSLNTPNVGFEAKSWLPHMCDGQSYYQRYRMSKQSNLNNVNAVDNKAANNNNFNNMNINDDDEDGVPPTIFKAVYSRKSIEIL